MEIDANNLSNLKLNELKNYQEQLKEKIGILEGEECIEQNKVYSKTEARRIVKECLKKK